MQQHALSSQSSENYEQVRILTVNNGEHLDGILYRLKKGFKRDFIFLSKY